MALMGIRPGEARALLVSDFRDGWLDVDEAIKGNQMDAPVRGTKSGKPKRLPTPDILVGWIERFVPRDARLRAEPLFVNPNTGGPWTPTSMRRCWEKACEEVGIEGISIYEGCKHSFATDAVARGVQERHLQAFLGHADVRSTRRYARLADAALIDVLPAAGRRSRERNLSRTCPAPDQASSKYPKKRENGGGGGNRTRVRMASRKRVYVRRPCSISATRVAGTGDVRPSPTSVSLPITAEQRSGASLLMTPATRQKASRTGVAYLVFARQRERSCRRHLKIPTVSPD